MNGGSGRRAAIVVSPVAALAALVLMAPAASASMVVASDAGSSSLCGTYGSYSVSEGIATCTYTDQGAEDTFAVPSYVTSLSVTAIGAPGGDGYEGGAGGLGAQVSNSALPVSAGAMLYVDVGQGGGNGTCDGVSAYFVSGGQFDGGEGRSGISGCYSGGGGGGSSALLDVPRSSATLDGNVTGTSSAVDSRLLVAGGGGGGVGGQAYPGGFAGATTSGPGAGGCIAGLSGGGGSGGLGPTDGTGAGGSSCGQGTSGSATSGGAGGGDGGGGGGGWFGGGGGGDGGGGGGSSYGGAGDGTVTVATASSSQQPEVVISWSLATPSLSTSASSGTIGGAISDSATLSGGDDPSGTVTFDAYGSGDSTCSSAPVYTSTVALNGGTASSGSFTPSSPGTYQWIATYNGDTNNASVSGICGGESSTVAQATPSLSTTASNGTLGQSISDSATLSGGDDPSGTVTFDAYGPGDSTCSDAPVYTTTVSLSGGMASGSFVPGSPGTYQWIATYNGDTNNASVSGTCPGSGESSTVSPPAKTTPKLTTSVDDGSTGNAWSGDETPGAKAFDTASLSGLAAGETPTGSVTYSLFDNGSCNAAAASTQTVNLKANGSVPNSADTARLEAGSYSYRAAYSGDGNYSPQTSSCEPFTVVPNEADVQVSISGPSAAADSTSFDEIVKLMNAGPAPAQDVVMALLVPSGVSVTTAGGGAEIAGTIVWTASSIAPGASDTYTVVFKVASKARGEAPFAVGAASLLTPDPDYANNAAVTTVDLGQSATVSNAMRKAHLARASTHARDPFAIGRRLVGWLRRLRRDGKHAR